MNYDINYAISLRGQTFANAGFGEGLPYDKAEQFIDFRTSCQMAFKDWGWDYPWYADMLGPNPDRSMTKEQWKNVWSSYRKYVSGYNDEEVSNG